MLEQELSVLSRCIIKSQLEPKSYKQNEEIHQIGKCINFPVLPFFFFEKFLCYLDW